MADVCKMSAFPVTRYSEQHELAEWGPPNYDYQHTRFLVIRAEAEVDQGKVKKFSTSLEDFITGYGNYPGKPNANWPGVVESELRSIGFIERGNPFDFKLWFRSRIAVALIGDFWEFSPKLAPITTKHPYGAQYFDLRRHHILPDDSFVNVAESEWEKNYTQYPSKCFSFFTQTPCRDSALGAEKVTHGFSLNIDLVMDGGNSRLPITIDPDIENKGGNPGP